MTEAEWLNCTDPKPMLEFLRGKVSDRKLRLFACACVRRVWHRMGEGVVSKEIEASELFAEGGSSRKELRAIRSQLGARGGYSAAWAANNALHAVLEDRADYTAKRAVTHATDFSYYQMLETDTDGQPKALAARETERTQLTTIVREIFGDSLSPVRFDPTWYSPTIVSLAHAVYDERILPSCELDNARLAVLSDALEEAGCNSEEILSHLRSPGVHVRGCWVIDALLGKK